MRRKHKTIPRSQADTAWKEVLEQFFEETIAFSFPELYSEINWGRSWDFLDKELQAITRGNIHGTRFVDKLIRVYLKDGDEKWLLIHIEIQGRQEMDFSKRMFIYHYRSFDKFGRHPLSCAILTDDAYTWRPTRYEHKQLGCALSFQFLTLKLFDLENQRSQLENSNNPFCCVIITQLNALKLKKQSPEEMFRLKLNETKRLYKKGFSHNIIRQLYQFIDALIRLPEDLDLQFKDDIFKFEEETNMAYISSIERFGIEKGLKQGLEKGISKGIQQRTKEIALRMIQKNQSIDFISEITGLSKKELSLLSQQKDEALNF